MAAAAAEGVFHHGNKVFRLGFRLIGLFVGGLMMLMLFGAVLTAGLFRILPLVFFVWLLVRIFTPRRTETM